MASNVAAQTMPVIRVGQLILIGPQQVPAIVSNEIPTPEDLFGKRYFVVCKSGQGIRARDGRRLGEAVLITVAWDGLNWTIKEAGFRVGETMPWLQPYVQQLDDLEQAAAEEDSSSVEEEVEEEQLDVPTLNRHWAIGQTQSHWI